MGDLTARLEALAAEAAAKGARLQTIPELKLVGIAYVGMSERILQALRDDEERTE